MRKRLTKTIWYGSSVDSSGNPILPSANGGLDGLNYGELFLHLSNSKATLWTLSSEGKIVEITGGGSDVDMSSYLLKSIWDKAFEFRTDKQGVEYIFSKLPVVAQYGITMYAGDSIDIPSLASGLPFDNRTIWYNPSTNQIEVIGGSGGGGEGGVSNFWDLSGIPSWITNSKPNYTYSEIDGTPDLSKYALVSQIPSLAGYATESWVLGKSYITSATLGTELGKYVTLDTDQSLKGKKDFKNGLSIDGLELRKSQDDVVYIDANLVVRGGVTMYAQNEVDIPSIIDSIPTASTTVKGIASFDGAYFSVVNGKVSLISSNVGLNEEELYNYLTSNNYAKKTDIPSLVGYATETWVNTRIDSLINGAPAAYDTLKEIADVLQGNVNSIGDIITALGTKWTQDNTKIANWDTAYSWGNHANAGYALKSYVDDTFVTLGTTQTITGEKNFTGGIKVNGSPIYYDTEKKYWKLEGDLLVTGGVTMYGSDSEFTPSTIMDAIQTDGVTIRVNPTTKNLEVIGNTSGATTLGGLSNVGNWADSVADVDRIMYQAAGSSNWVAKSLSSIGGGVSGDYLPLSGGELTGPLAVTAKSNGYWSGGIRIDGTTDMPPSLAFHIPSKIGSRIYVDVNSPYDIIHELSTFSPVEKRIILHSDNYSSYALPLSGGTLNGNLFIGTPPSSYDSTRKVLSLITPNDDACDFILGANSTQYWSISARPTSNVNYAKSLLFHNYVKGGAAMIISTDNNVGIGTITPKTSLHVSGSNTVTLVANSTSSNETAMAFHLSNVAKAYVGWSKTYGAYLYNSPKGYYLSIKDDGSLFYNGGTIWHSGNDGSGSGLDADTIDGKHLSDLMKIKSLYDSDDDKLLSTKVWSTGVTGKGDQSSQKECPTLYGMYISLQYDTSKNMGYQFYGNTANSTPTLYVRNRQAGNQNVTYNDWKEIAFLDSNVASATKLQTARTIWGQSFDGTGNVSGDLSLLNYRILGNNAIDILNSQGAWVILGAGCCAKQWNTYVDGYDIHFRYGTSSTTGMLLNHDGRVGIGTTAPSQKLHVEGSIQINGTIGGARSIMSNTTNGYFVGDRNDGLGTSDGGLLLYSYKATPISLYTNSQERMRITSSGDVGIGMSNPTLAKLQVVGNEMWTAGFDSPNTLVYCAHKNGHGVYIGSKSSSNSIPLIEAWHGQNTLGSGGTCDFMITAEGKIGIGTNSPSDKLDVRGNIITTGDIKMNNQCTMWAKNASGSYEQWIWPRWSDNATYMNYGSGNFYIRNRSSAHVMTMLNSGNVGIGTTSPSYKLDVHTNSSSYVVARFLNTTYHGGIAIDAASSYNPFINLRQAGNGVAECGYSNSKKTFYFGASGTDAGHFNISMTNGYVGIGTYSPTQPLHIVKSSTSQGDMIEMQSKASWCNIVYSATSGYKWSVGCNTSNQFYFWNNYLSDSAVIFYNNGGILAKGGITMYSDQRKKTILNHVELSLKDIANAPLIEHYYNSDDKKTTHVGSIAQYWAGMNDWFCKLDNEGYYTMEIQNAALASAISIARELDRYESKTDKTIKQLKKRICQLEEEVERLRAS